MFNVTIIRARTRTSSIIVSCVLSVAIFQSHGVLVSLPAAMVHSRIHMGLFVGSVESAVEKGGDRNISIQDGSETKERYV